MDRTLANLLNARVPTDTPVLNAILDTISKGISGLSGNALVFAGALAIAGTIAMAILQILKELTPLRRWYQHAWLTRWFHGRAARFTAAADTAEPGTVPRLRPVDAVAAQTGLVELATGGEVDAFYDLTIEQLVAQMNAAAQVALEYPAAHFPLLAVLSQGAAVADVMRVLDDAMRKPTPNQEPDMGARNRVGHRIQRNLDGIQIALGSRWKFWMQAAAIALTVGLVEIAIIWNVASWDVGTVLVGAALGLVGGYLAPVTRDILAAVQTLRNP